jgi:hypothetical protein
MVLVQAETCSVHVKAHFELKETCIVFDEISVVSLLINTTGRPTKNLKLVFLPLDTKPVSVHRNYSRRNQQCEGELVLENPQNTPKMKALIL